ncbi:MAG: hypothetical protein COA96_04790 [SAR86 cluster bacterium]|uniref:Flagellar protein FliL n=1 Tax=SAR86 cluster bacterium TaxID=2030880 RepID=A0A2A5B525_9GAMM|nr:MAG: hypothetical protein COA96_04790 [SAR86 cluster bacterium]
MKKSILMVLVGALTVSGGGGGAYYLGFLDKFLGIEEVLAQEAGAEEEIVEELPPAIFHVVPPLTVSSTYNGGLHYLQVKMSIMTRNEDTIEKLENNAPIIQDSLIMLLNSYNFSQLQTVEGKENLRNRAEEEIRGIIRDDSVESVLFTGFVIQ